VIAQLRSELLKQRSTSTNLGLFLAMLVLVLLSVLLHALTLPAEQVDSAADQVQVFRFGSLLGALFAGLAGAMSITGEIRHGTIRPTFLITPQRARVVAAKVVAGAVVGAAVGLFAVAVAIGAGSAALAARGIPSTLDGSDYALLLVGGIVGAALWAAIGLGLGGLIRNQVASLVSIFACLFFVENLLIDRVPGALMPGAAAAAITGLDRVARPTPSEGRPCHPRDARDDYPSPTRRRRRTDAFTKRSPQDERRGATSLATWLSDPSGLHPGNRGRRRPPR
jgi:ABC-2 type transport system permease protein